MPSRRPAQSCSTIFSGVPASILPERGRIGIFNRSHYEEVLVVRVHPDMLERQMLPPGIAGNEIWQRRFKEINAFERHVAWNGTLILKFHLRISKDEQRKRFVARLEEPVKRWKFSMSDVTDRRRWDEYMAAYDDMIRSTSTEEAPWYVVPADHKHVARLVVCAASWKPWRRLSSTTRRSRARRSRN